jgi:enoyl-CoA hydratase
VSEDARVQVVRDGPVFHLSIARPDAGNAVAGRDLEALARLLREASDDPSVRVVVLRGQGDRFFCTGSDIAELAGGVADIGTHLGKWHTVVDLLETCPKPVIAAINGAAVGGGLELALACHRRVAADGVKIGLPELKVGLFPAAGGVRRITRLLGASRALDLVLGAGMISAEEARRWGLVDHVVALGELDETVAAQAAALAAFEPNAVTAVLACAQAAAVGQDTNALETALLRECYDNPRNREVLRSFLERPRAPRAS